MKKNIPNIITILNLACGCVGIGMALRYINNIDDYKYLIYASYMIGFAGVFDFFDGMTARLLNVKSTFGKELDSLADVVSFGVLPGLILYCLLNIALEEAENFRAYIPFVAFLIPVFSALRLAKFNIDTKQTDSFIGLPTPANAIFIASIPFILVYQSEQIPFITNILGNPGVLVVLVFLLSFLLVSPIPLFSLKFKDISWSKNSLQYTLIISSVVLLIFFYFLAIPIIFFLYILLSIINNTLKK